MDYGTREERAARLYGRAAFAWGPLVFVAATAVLLLLQTLARYATGMADLRSVVFPAVTMMLAATFMWCALFVARGPFAASAIAFAAVGIPAYAYSWLIVGSGPMPGPGLLVFSGLASLSSVACALYMRTPIGRSKGKLPPLVTSSTSA